MSKFDSYRSGPQVEFSEKNVPEGSVVIGGKDVPVIVLSWGDERAKVKILTFGDGAEPPDGFETLSEEEMTAAASGFKIDIIEKSTFKSTSGMVWIIKEGEGRGVDPQLVNQVLAGKQDESAAEEPEPTEKAPDDNETVEVDVPEEFVDTKKEGKSGPWVGRKGTKGIVYSLIYTAGGIIDYDTLKFTCEKAAGIDEAALRKALKDLKKDGYLIDEMGIGTANHRVYIGETAPSSPLDTATMLCGHIKTMASLVPEGMTCEVTVSATNTKGERAIAGVTLRWQQTEGE